MLRLCKFKEAKLQSLEDEKQIPPKQTFKSTSKYYFCTLFFDEKQVKNHRFIT